MSTYRWLTKLISRRQRRRPVILSYHRVAEPEWDPWGLAVSPRNFAEQLDVLQRTRTILALDELVNRLERGTLPPDAVAVSFDDGYRDNLTVAKPLLESYGIAATVFIATGAIGADIGFWWDELADMVLGAPEIRGVLRSCDLPIELSAIEDTDDRRWRVEAGAVSSRQVLYIEAWRRLKAADEDARTAAMAEFRDVLGRATPKPDALPMGEEELVSLIDGGLIGIGAHTVHHPALSSIPRDRQQAEILESRRACREIAGDAVRGFAYPYGDRSRPVIESVRACGFAWACSTESTAIAGHDIHDLPRVQVLDWDGDTFSDKLSALEAAPGSLHGHG